MRRWTTILLIGAILTLGSGAMQFAHNRDAHGAGDDQHHNEANCLLHALMKGPMLDTAGASQPQSQ